MESENEGHDPQAHKDRGEIVMDIPNWDTEVPVYLLKPTKKQINLIDKLCFEMGYDTFIPSNRGLCMMMIELLLEEQKEYKSNKNQNYAWGADDTHWDFPDNSLHDGYIPDNFV